MTEVEEFHGTGTFETIVLEGDTFLQTEEMVPEEAFDTEIAAVSRRLSAAQSQIAAAAAAAPAPAPAPSPAPVPSAAPAPAFDPHADADSDLDADIILNLPPAAPTRAPKDPPRENLQAAASRADSYVVASTPASETAAVAHLEAARARIPRSALTACVLLVLLLAIQAVHHWRNDLATRATLHGPLSALFAKFGQPLTPSWNLSLYEVRQLGAGTDSSDSHTIVVRFSLANHASAAQALPLVRLTLLDRYGKALSAGELAPAQYLPASLRGLQMLAPEQRIDTEVGVADDSQQASSFELDVCLAAAGGGLRCAGDGAAAATGIASAGT